MPTPTYDLIASNVLTSSASSVTFSSIPATYRDLVFVAEWNVQSGFGTYVKVRFNSDSGTNYSLVEMKGDGASAVSTSSTGENGIFVGDYNAAPTANQKFLTIQQIMDYSATDKHKTVLERSNNASGVVTGWAHRWASTSAITSLQILCVSAGQTFSAGNSFYLYGIVS